MITAKTVNREPSTAQIEAAYIMIGIDDEHRARTIAAAIWRAMFDFAPKARQATRLPRQQQAAHEFIAAHIAEHGFAPTYQEIAEALKLPGTKGQAFAIVRSLAKRGVVALGDGKARSIRLLTEPGQSAPQALACTRKDREAPRSAAT